MSPRKQKLVRRRMKAKQGTCFWCGRMATCKCDRCEHWLCVPENGCSQLRKLPAGVSRYQLICAWPCRTRRPVAAIRVSRGLPAVEEQMVTRGTVAAVAGGLLAGLGAGALAVALEDANAR